MVGGGVCSDDPKSEEIPEYESDFDILSIGCFETFCEAFLRSEDACLSETCFSKGFSRFGSDFPGMERAFDLSECSVYFADWRGCGPPME